MHSHAGAWEREILLSLLIGMKRYCLPTVTTEITGSCKHVKQIEVSREAVLASLLGHGLWLLATQCEPFRRV